MCYVILTSYGLNPLLKQTKETWIKCHLPLSAAYRDTFLTLDLQRAVGNNVPSPSPMLILHGDRDRSVPLEMPSLTCGWDGLAMKR